jgi:hypothetical protein
MCCKKNWCQRQCGKYTYECTVKCRAELGIIFYKKSVRHVFSNLIFSLEVITCNTERAINHREIVSTPEQQSTLESKILLLSNSGIINLDIKHQVKNIVHKVEDSTTTGVNYHNLAASIPKSTFTFRRSVSPLSCNA